MSLAVTNSLGPFLPKNASVEENAKLKKNEVGLLRIGDVRYPKLALVMVITHDTWLKCKAWAKCLKKDVTALYHAYNDPRCPKLAKVVAIATVAYAVSPIDLIPDFIPILGILDDLILVPAGLALSIKLIPKEIFEDARKKVEQGEKLPKSKVAGAVVIMIWAISFFAFARYFKYL